MDLIIIYFSIKYKGDWDQIYKALSDKERVEEEEIKKIRKEIEKSKYKIITIIDDDYPEVLKVCYKPPFVLWLKGNYDILNKSFIALTGDNVDDISKKRILDFVPKIEKSFYITSTSFKGIDQEVCDNAKKGILYILPNGLEKPCINRTIKQNDLLITEYPPNVNIKKERFRNRNRIYASFASKLILFTSKKNGGINNAIINFINLGKDIYCFPGDGNENDGNSELIKQGAYLITSISDIE